MVFDVSKCWWNCVNVSLFLQDPVQRLDSMAAAVAFHVLAVKEHAIAIICAICMETAVQISTRSTALQVRVVALSGL